VIDKVAHIQYWLTLSVVEILILVLFYIRWVT